MIPLLWNPAVVALEVTASCSPAAAGGAIEITCRRSLSHWWRRYLHVVPMIPAWARDAVVATAPPLRLSAVVADTLLLLLLLREEAASAPLPLLPPLRRKLRR